MYHNRENVESKYLCRYLVQVFVIYRIALFNFQITLDMLTTLIDNFLV